MRTLKYNNKFIISLFFTCAILHASVKGTFNKENKITKEQSSGSQFTATSDDNEVSESQRIDQNPRLIEKVVNDLVNQEHYLRNSFPRIHELNIAEKVKEELKTGLSDDTLLMIVNCKRFLRKMFSEGGPLSWMDNENLIKNEDSDNSKLGVIYKLASIQNDILDKAMLENMYHEHLTNRPKATKPLQKAVIVGAGPSGLYAAFQLYLAGIEVTLVNDREHYIRNQIIAVDSNWRFLLRLLLGSEFDRLVSRIQLAEDNSEEINLKYFETALKSRLTMLAEYAHSRKGDDSSLKLLHGVAVERIQFPKPTNPKYYAVLKTVKSSTTNLADFDILVCAAGAKDNIRNTYLGIPKEHTVAKNHAIAILIKGPKFLNKKLMNLRGKVNFKDFQQNLHQQRFEQFISQSRFLSNYIKRKYSNFTNYFQKTISELRAYENKLSIYFGAVTDPFLAEFLKDVEQEKNSLDKSEIEKIKQYDEFETSIVRRWFAAMLSVFVNIDRQKSEKIHINVEQKKDEDKLNFDPYPVNTSTFDLIQMALDKSAVEYNVLGRSAIVLAVGDSAASSHFNVGNVTAPGRINV